MAKIAMTVTLKKSDGSQLGTSISVEKPTKSEAEAAIGAVIQARVDAGSTAQADLVDAQNAFNS
jgi:hypothetical protein